MATAVTEDAVHISILIWIRLHLTYLVWHTPNGQRRSLGEQRKAKALGMMAGVPDLCFIMPDGRVCFFEVKKPGYKPSSVSESQRLFGDMARRHGALWAVVSSKAEAIEHCRAWGIYNGKQT